MEYSKPKGMWPDEACEIHRIPLTQRGLSNEKTLATDIGLSL